MKSTNPELIALRLVAENEHRATVSPYGFPMDCVFEFYEGEPAILWPTELAHPGAPDCCQLLQAFVGGVDIYEMLSSDQIERIEETYLERRK